MIAITKRLITSFNSKDNCIVVISSCKEIINSEKTEILDDEKLCAPYDRRGSRRIAGECNSAFWGCAGLTSITFPDSVTNIVSNPFICCENLTEILVSPDHPTLAIIDGVLFSKSGKRPVCYKKIRISN